MSAKKTTEPTGLDQVARTRSQRALTPGLDPAKMRQKLSEAFERVRSEAIASERARLREEGLRLAGFEGQVMAHSSSQEMLRIKISVASGLCYRCHSQAADSNDASGCCMACAQGS